MQKGGQECREGTKRMFPVGTSFGSLLTTPTSTIAAINRLLVGGVASRFMAHPTEEQVNNENDDRKNGGVFSGHSTFSLETKELIYDR